MGASVAKTNGRPGNRQPGLTLAALLERPYAPAELVNTLFHRRHTVVQAHQSPVHLIETPLNSIESDFDTVKAPLDTLKAPLDALEPFVDATKLYGDGVAKIDQHR